MDVTSQIATENKFAANDLNLKCKKHLDLRNEDKKKAKKLEMSFWQCPACVKESYFCGMTHLKLHLMSEHNISGRTLTKMIEGLTPAFESDARTNSKVSVSEEETFSESKQQEEEVHQQ